MATTAELEAAFMRAHAAGDTKNAQILADAVRASRSAAPTATTEAPEAPQDTAFNQVIGGITHAQDRAALGIKEMLPQSVQNFGDKLDEMTGFGSLKDRVEKGRKYVKDQSWLANAGQIGADTALGAVTAPAKGGLLGTMGIQSLYNYLTTPDDEGRVKSAALGAAAPVVGNVVSKAITGPLKNAMTGEAKILTDEGVTLTPGQMLSGDSSTASGRFLRDLEDKAQSIPVIGDIIKNARIRAGRDYNKVELNQALEPIGVELKVVGQNGLDQARDRVNDVITRNIPNISILPSVARPTITRAVQNASQDMAFDAGHANKLNKLIAVKIDPLISGNKVIDGNTANMIYRHLGDEIKKVSGESDLPLRNALQEVQNAWSNSMQGTTRTATQDLINANTSSQALLKLERAAENSSSATFTPRQVQQAAKSVKTNDADFAKVARPVLEDRVPDSATAARINLNSALRYGLAAGATTLAPAATAGATLGTAGVYSRPFLNYLAKGIKGNEKIDPEVLQDVLMQLSRAGLNKD